MKSLVVIPSRGCLKMKLCSPSPFVLSVVTDRRSVTKSKDEQKTASFDFAASQLRSGRTVFEKNLNSRLRGNDDWGKGCPFKIIKEKLLRFFFALMTICLVSCTVEELPELSIESVSIYAEPDANQNSAVAVDLVLVYNQDLLKTIGQMSAAKYFDAARQLLLDNPSLLDIWHWELVPGQMVEDFSPDQDKGDDYGGYVFANYLTPGDHRVRVSPNGIVKILLLRDDLKNLAMTNAHDLRIGTTMSNVSDSDMDEDESPCIKMGPINTPMQSCQRRALPPCPIEPPCTRPSQPVQIITKPLNPPLKVSPQSYGQ